MNWFSKVLIASELPSLYEDDLIRKMQRIGVKWVRKKNGIMFLHPYDKSLQCLVHPKHGENNSKHYYPVLISKILSKLRISAQDFIDEIPIKILI